MTEKFVPDKPVRETDGPLPPVGRHNQLTLPLGQPIIYYRVRAWSVDNGEDGPSGPVEIPILDINITEAIPESLDLITEK